MARIHRFILVLFLVQVLTLSSQNVGINGTGNNPNASAMLDIEASNKGLLIPRVALTSNTDAITIASGNVASLLVYNTATAGASPNNVLPGYYYWDGTNWISISGGSGGKDWSLTGNAGTTVGTHFLGTTDAQPFMIKVNNQKSGYIDWDANLANTSFGFQSFLNNTTGGYNTANGYQALYSNTTGSGNNATGRLALFSNTTGFSNTANGVQALQFNTTGNFNTANGYQALRSNTTGSGNNADGYQALRFNTTGNNNTANGYKALYSNTTGGNNTADGFQAGVGNTSGANNTFVGYSAGSAITTGSNNIAIGNNAQVPTATNSNQVRIGNTAITYAGVQVAWTITSDQRWKKETRTLPYGLNLIKQLKPVDYLRIDAEDKNREMGFIAQEVEQALKSVNYKDQGFLTKTEKGFYELRYNDFIALLVKGMQEQQTIIENQNTNLELLKKELETIKKHIGLTK